MNRRLLTLILLAVACGPFRALAQETNAPSALDKSFLQILARKNIFDPTRTGYRPGRRAPRVESFTFCGGAFDGPRSSAFFSGNGAPSRPLKPGDTINGFKIDAITFQSVQLKPAEGPAVTLAMGTTMRKEENGPWKLSAAPEIEAPASTAVSGAAAPSPASAANESDIIKRLRAKRDEN